MGGGSVMGDWRTAWFCVNCDKRLSNSTVMYSDGRCLHCGYKGEHAGTIVDTYEKAYRVEFSEPSPWWKFWVLPKRSVIWLEEE